MADNEGTIIIPMPSQQGVPMPARVDRADFVDKIKPEIAAENMRHKFLGEEWNGQMWVKNQKLAKNALSETGAWELTNMVLAAGSINISISKLTKEQIGARLRNLIMELMVKILSNWRDYNIQNVGQIYYIKSIVFSNALGVLSQAGEGSIQELFKTTVSENRNIGIEKKEPGRLKRMLGLGGG